MAFLQATDAPAEQGKACSNDMTDETSRLKELLGAAAEELPPLSLDKRETIQLRVNLGRCLLVAGDARTALRLAEEVLEHVEAHKGATVLRIDASLEVKDGPEPKRLLEEAGPLPENHEKRLRSRMAERGLGDPDRKPAPRPEEAEQAGSDDIGGLIERGRRHLADNRLTEARIEFEKALALDRKTRPAWLGLINVAIRQSDPGTAHVLSEQALKVLPGDPSVTGKSARTLIMLGRLGDARHLLEEAIGGAERPHPGLSLALAHVLSELGEFDTLDALHEELAASAPGHAEIWFSRIRAAFKQGDMDRALELCFEATTTCPDNIKLKLQTAVMLMRAGREDEAISALKVLRGNDLNDSSIALALATALRQADRTEEADHIYREILDAEPENWPALEGRVAIAEARGALDLALDLLEERSQPAQPKCNVT